MKPRAWSEEYGTQEQRNLLNASDIRELLEYNPLTGVLTWRRNMTPRARAGKEAGVIQCGKYRRVGIYGKYYMAHRLAWIIVTGEWPREEIDHRNGVKSDNRWSNLRHASPAENKQNTLHKNKTGLIGASYYQRTGLYRAQIRTKNGRVFLGWHKTAEEASAAYKKAAKIFHGEFAKC